MAEYEQSMLQALREHRPRGHGLFRRLWNTLRSIRSVPHPVEERRTVPRLICELPVVILVDGGAKGGTMIDVGLFGLSTTSFGPIRAGSKVRMLLAEDETLEEVVCKVRWCAEQENDYLLGMVYAQKPSLLSKSWVCSLLHELGYDFEQRRQFIRAKSDIPATLAGHPGHLCDIGVGGALFCTPKEQGLGAEALLRIEHSQELPALNLHTAIRNVREEDGLWYYSLQFDDVTDEETDALGRYVFHVLHSHEE